MGQRQINVFMVQDSRHRITMCRQGEQGEQGGLLMLIHSLSHANLAAMQAGACERNT